MITTTCCFTGHRHLPQEQMPDILSRLHYTTFALIEEGFTTFLCGGTLGFDMWAAIYIMSQKMIAQKDIRLILALPYPGYNNHWDDQQKETFNNIMDVTDEINYISSTYDAEAMKRRNYYMVDHSSVCVCAWLYSRSGTGQTVRYAQRQGHRVFNLAETRVSIIEVK